MTTLPEATIEAIEMPLLRRIGLALECAMIFIGFPAFLYFHATRWNVHLGLWVVALYALVLMRRSSGFSWREIWHGDGWSAAQKKTAVLRFGLCTAAIIGLTCILAPDRLFSFPVQRPIFWLLVMILYPILSVVPQELIFRSFFFRRYGVLFPNQWMMIAASAFVFGFVHTVFHNPVSPLLSLIAGVIFAHGYSRHRSLRWAALEHAAYGCMVFTVGLGAYFLVGGFRH